MPNMNDLTLIAKKMNRLVEELFQQSNVDVILFGSFARGNAENGSDVDLMLLVDAPREEISRKSWQIGDAAAELLFEHGVVVSPIVENRSFYLANRSILPFYRSIDQEGVRLLA